MHSHMITSYRFGGPIALHGLVHFLNTTGPSLTEVVYAYFDRISYGHLDGHMDGYMDIWTRCMYGYVAFLSND